MGEYPRGRTLTRQSVRPENNPRVRGRASRAGATEESVMQYDGDHDTVLDGERTGKNAPLRRDPVVAGDQSSFAYRHPPASANLTTTDGRGTYAMMRPRLNHAATVDGSDSGRLPQSSAAVVYYNTCRGSGQAQLYRPVEPIIHGSGLSQGGPSVTLRG